MKKLTILLAVIVFAIFGVRCLQESERRAEEERIAQQRAAEIEKAKLGGGRNSTNKQIRNYEGLKVRGSEVKVLFSLVETLNEQDVFPIDIRYGDVVPGSYEWTATITENINSGDSIRDSAWYEIVMQNQLESDDLYLDTIAIRPYSADYKSNQLKSKE